MNKFRKSQCIFASIFFRYATNLNFQISQSSAANMPKVWLKILHGFIRNFVFFPAVENDTVLRHDKFAL